MIIDSSNNLYQFLLDEIYKSRGLDSLSDNAQEKYLQNLQPLASSLWKKYKAHHVEVAYDNKSYQECYLLRYFVPYSYFLSSVLEDIDFQKDFKEKKFVATFFGSGPGPEVISLIRYVEKLGNLDCLEINMIDVNNWSYSTNILTKLLRSLSLNFKLKINIERYDFNEFIEEDSLIEKIISQSNLLLFQNCLNEFSTNGSCNSNMQTLVAEMPDHARIVFIEQSIKYSSSNHIVGQLLAINDYSYYKFKLLAYKEKFIVNLSKVINSLPDIINQNLFTRDNNDEFFNKGLVLRKYHELCYFVLKREETNE